MQDIAKYFLKARLPVALTDRPIGNMRDNNADKVFQMTIDAGKPERFRIFRGIGNDVRVLDYDKGKEQVLLFVKEPKRRFIEVRFDADKRRDVEIERETPDYIRRYLLGMDERHLFISELPDRQGKINTIEDAHRVLKPHEVKDAKKCESLKAHRQGEWFFRKATQSELSSIEEHLETYGKLSLIQTNSAIARAEKPHIAEQLLRIDDATFVRGKVCHSDHKTLKFISWHRVFRNAEKLDPRGVRGWID